MPKFEAEDSRSGSPAFTAGSSNEQRLAEKSLDIGAATPADIFKTFSVVHDLAVKFLARRDFCRIATPSLIGYMYPGEEDDHFAVPYFDQGAWLAPTGEVHLGMALVRKLERVYDIHNVFRREEVVDSRHLTEFTMLELVFSLNQDWEEILTVMDELLIFIIQSIQQNSKYAALFQRAQLLGSCAEPFQLGLAEKKLCRISFHEAKRVLLDVLKIESGMDDGLTPMEEAALGRYFSRDETYFGQRTDIFVITRFPRHIRPCNVYPSNDGKTTHSFDVIMRGQEIITGCQLLNSPEDLRAAFATRHHPIDPDSPGWRPFMAAHEAGMPPWGGFGMGLNRFVQSLLGLGDIRETTLFPRNASCLLP